MEEVCIDIALLCLVWFYYHVITLHLSQHVWILKSS